MNRERLKQVIDHITANPQEWDQSQWHCGTTHCLAGHAQIMSGKPADRDTVKADARIWLEMSYWDSLYMFSGGRTLDDFNAVLSETEGYNRAGYGRDGYNRDGYDRDGYNRDGYDRDGYDRDGYGRDGYNRAGYGRDGYNRDGYDRDGYDRDGLDINIKPRPIAA